MRFQDLGAPASEAKSCQCSKVESHEQSKPFVAGVQGPLRVLEAFEFLMLKYAFSHILETLFLSFLTASSKPRTDKNSIYITLYFNQFEMFLYIIPIFFIFMKKLCLC